MPTDHLRIKATYPTPYEYALISKAIYQDEWGDETQFTKEQNILEDKGWRLAGDLIQENDYIAGFFVNDKTNQCVIAHRGSQNITSWITDVESVILNKKGVFVDLAIKTLNHPAVQNARQDGYRISTTGHSLGGFLAQLCVYWAQRADTPEAYYPEMSAMCFDAPGAAKMMDALESNIRSQKGRVEIDKLDIHNFCMSTIVSLFGEHTGTVWHLPSAGNVSLSFVNAHKMEHILNAFDSYGELPKFFRQMTDWPCFELKDYLKLKEDFEQTIKNSFEKLIPNLINQLWKNFFKKDDGNTWFDQLFTDHGPIITYFKTRRKLGCYPTFEDVEAQISVAISNHYLSLSEKNSRLTMPLHHFDPEIQEFLLTVEMANKIGCAKDLEAAYDEDFTMLTEDVQLKRQGNKTDVILPPNVNNIFEYRCKLLKLLKDFGVMKLSTIASEKIEKLENHHEKLEAINNFVSQLSGEQNELKQQLIDLKEKLEYDMKKKTDFVFEDGNITSKGNNALVIMQNTQEESSLAYKLALLNAASQNANTYGGNYKARFNNVKSSGQNSVVMKTTQGNTGYSADDLVNAANKIPKAVKYDANSNMLRSNNNNNQSSEEIKKC